MGLRLWESLQPKWMDVIASCLVLSTLFLIYPSYMTVEPVKNTDSSLRKPCGV
jgi:hypothetical protein